MKVYERDEVVPLDSVEVPSCCFLAFADRARGFHGVAYDAWVAAGRPFGDVEERVKELDEWTGFQPFMVRRVRTMVNGEVRDRSWYLEYWKRMDEADECSSELRRGVLCHAGER